MKVLTIENGGLKVSVDCEHGWFDVLEKETGTVWEHDPFESSPGELTLKRKKDGSLVTFDLGEASEVTVKKTGTHAVELEFKGLKTEDGKRVAEVSVKTRVSIAEEKPELKIEVLDVSYGDEWKMDSLLYPARHFYLKTFVDQGYLAVPYWQGSLVPSHKLKYPQSFWLWDDYSWASDAYLDLPYPGWGGLTMPWFGMVKGKSSFVAVAETDDNFSVNCILNYTMQHLFNPKSQTSPYPRIVACSPKWLGTLGEFSYPRALTYYFIPKGNYVSMAKKYREYAKKTGLFRSLKEKIKENQNVEKLFGAPMFNIVCWGYPWYTDYEAEPFKKTWKDIERFATELHDDIGLERAFIIVWGGYSKLPPESFPFDHKMGTEKDLAITVDTIKKYGYLYGAYHNYTALLENATSWDPRTAKKDEHGRMGGWRWGRNCSAFYLKYAKENLPPTIAVTKQNADYNDGLTAGGFSECYDKSHPNHPQSTKQDRLIKTEVLKYIRSLGLVTGSECSMAWCVPYLDYAKGGLYSGHRSKALLGVYHAPLFNLVFHGAQVIYSYGLYLENIAIGNHLILNYPDSASAAIAEKNAIKRLKPVLEFCKNIALDEFENHEYLTETYDVQRSVFSSGTEITTNFSKAEFTTAKNEKVPSNGYLVKYPDGRTYSGTI